jgi:hypothetical protein
MAATVEHVRFLGDLEGCQEVPQASQRHRTFLVGYTRGRIRDAAWAGVRATQCHSVSHRCPSLSCALWK